MRKILAVLMTFSMVLAGCMDLTDEDVESIVDSIVDLPGCNDETAYNYDENATNNLACLTEQVLKDSVTDFINLVDNGPAWGETMGMMMEGSETDSDGMTTSFTTTMAVSPDGMFVMTEMDMGMMVIEIGELMTENADGTTNIQSTWMGNTFQMNTEAVFDDHWNEQSFNEDDDHDEDHSDEMVCYDMDTHTVLTEINNQADCENGDYMWVPANSGPDGDDSHDGDHSDDMDDMDDMDLGLPDTDVEIPDDFDPATALYTAGLSTSNGYSFTTVVEHDADYSTTMTFTLSTDLAVTSLVMVESYDGMTSTSSITILDAEAADQLLVNDETLVEHALPFTLSPMGGDDHDGHDHGDHDDHDGDDGDHDGHDHGDEITSLEDFDVSSWDSTNDLQQIVDWFNDNYMYEQDETLMQVGDFLSLCDADPDYVDNYVAECVFNSAMNMLHNDDHDGHDHGDDDGDHEGDHGDGGHDDHDDDSDDDMSEADAWALMDADGDGYANVSEIVDGFIAMDAPTPEEAMEDSDADNSGGISWDEFVAEWNSDEEEGSDENLSNNAQLASDLHAAFNSSDADNDDNLSIDELGSFIDQVVSLTSDEEDTAEMTEIIQLFVNCVDTDDDGLLDEMEFSEFYMMLNDESDEMLFCMFDTDGDDLITPSEYASFMNDSEDGAEPMTEDDWQMFVDMINMYDFDGNGGLDGYEFTALMESMEDGDDDSDGVYWEPYHGGYCEWEGNPDDEQDVWSCKDDASDSDWDDWWYYCELHGEDWYCTDDYGQSSEFEYSAGNTNYEHGDHDGHDHDDHDDHMMAYDWMIDTADMMSETEVIGAFADYHIVLANCVSESSDDMMGGETLSCGDDVLKVTLAEATAPGAEIMFHDADSTGTITAGDMIHINPDIDAGGEWNTVRLYSVDADKYSDENPMMTPGFGAFAGIVALLGAALLTRRD